MKYSQDRKSSDSIRRGSITKRVPASSAAACRPVSSALAQAVARRRNSQQSTNIGNFLTTTSDAQRRPQQQKSTVNEAVPWTPRLPSQIEPVKESEHLQADEYLESYSSPRKSKERVAHKPTIAKNKHKRPLVPAGHAKKVPQLLRTRYLDVIINEYLNTGHPEEQSYENGLKEEASIAERAANRSIYLNLVAGLKKRIREKAGILIKNQQNEAAEFVNGNRVVSHSEILTGKVRGTISVEKKQIKSCDPTKLSETELYDKLMRYLMPIDLLDAYNYPCPNSENPEIRKPPLGKDGQMLQLRPELASSYICDRCTKVYRVDESGLPLPTTGKCIYHPGHLWNERINRSLEKRYSCCKGDPSAGGCSSNPYHVHNGQHELENYKGYVDTLSKPHLDPNKHGIFALDCEMCYTTYGLELTRVTVINYKYEVVYERLVKPTRPILDYNTKFSGIKEGDLDNVTMTLVEVQKDLLDMFSSKSILVGHSLDSDMRALKLYHKRVVDTAHLFPHKRGLPFKRALRTLMLENLQIIIQEDAGHDSKEDASAALKLVMWKIRTDVPENTK